jgi:hypothetical protein
MEFETIGVDQGKTVFTSWAEQAAQVMCTTMLVPAGSNLSHACRVSPASVGKEAPNQPLIPADITRTLR